MRPSSRLAALILCVLVGAFALWRTTRHAGTAPRFTLLVHPVDESHDPTEVVAALIVRKGEHWDWSARLPRDLGGAEKILWIEQIGGGGSARLFGGYSVRGGEMYFTPAAPLTRGATYRVAFVPPEDSGTPVQWPANVGFAAASGNGRLDLVYEVPASETKAPMLKSVHPTAAELPENTLKFYLAFSEPMEQGVFTERIKLLRADGSEVTGPFRETELWSPDGKRLTVWLHPGRQKTGVSLNEVEGAVLREGEDITINISGAWRSARGQPLGVEFKRTYRVAAPAHSRVDPARWTIHTPKAAAREPLRIGFPAPLDWALLHNSISVTDEAGQVIDGALEIPEAEREWRFTPRTEWKAGSGGIVINPLLEDLAGNNLDRAFEANLDEENEGASRQPATKELRFRIE